MSGGGSAGPLPSQPLTTRAGPGAPASGATGSGAPAAGASGAGSTLAALGIPSATTLRDASPARRRQLLRLAWDAPLREGKLRRLRETLAAYGGCFDELSARGRRTLILRAGLDGRKPVSRRTIARRLGVSLKRELRVESGALSQLTSAGERGLCGGAALGAAGSVRAQELAAAAGSQGGRWSGDGADERNGVLGVQERGDDSKDGGGPSLGFVDGPGDGPSALLLLALAVLGPLAVALLAARSKGTAKQPRS